MPQAQMTVGEMIERLRRFDPCWPILVQDDAALRPPQFVTEGTDNGFVESETPGVQPTLVEYPVVMVF